MYGFVELGVELSFLLPLSKTDFVIEVASIVFNLGLHALLIGFYLLFLQVKTLHNVLSISLQLSPNQLLSSADLTLINHFVLTLKTE